MPNAPLNEPSVLDYVKSRLLPGRYPPVELAESGLPTHSVVASPVIEARLEPPPEPAEAHARPPWLILVALILAIAGQASFEPSPDRGWAFGAALLLAAVGLTAISQARGEWRSAPPPASALETDPPVINLLSLVLALGLAFFGLFLFLNEPPQFSLGNLIPIAGSLALAVYAFSFPSPHAEGLWKKLWGLAARPSVTITLDRPALAGLLAIALVLFFRLYRLGQVPPEMNSDHAEKILDILRVLNGQNLVFFPTNGGREALIFYLDAALHRIFGIPIGFGLLKAGSTLIGLAALPFVYGLGVELGNRRVAWLAFVLSGIAYWTNVVSRFGLRLPFYFLFTAALLYYLVRGLRMGRRNDLIIAGIFLGLGFYGYTPNRLLPLVVILAFGLYLLHHRSRSRWQFALLGLIALSVVTFVIFVPLLGYIFIEPQAFLARTLTRFGGVEQPIVTSPITIFLQNFGRALAMFSWDNGIIWPVSVPNRPALSIVAGALFYIGAAALSVRYVLNRAWQDLFLLLSIPMLQLPSTLALAFPGENPNLYRTGGAMVPVFILAATALDGLMHAVQHRINGRLGRQVAWGVALLLVGLSAVQDYALVFDEFYNQYRISAWNTSELGAIAGEFAARTGSPDTMWIVAYPHWVDSRLVAINAGYPGRDFRLYPEELERTLEDGRAKLFLLHPQDLADVETLQKMYPLGALSVFPSKTPTKEFQVFFVPAREPLSGQ